MKNKKTTKNLIKRSPRALGLTLLAQQTRNEPITKELISKILNYVFNQGLQINNKPITIQSLAVYLQVPKTTVLKQYVEYNNKMGKFMFGKDEDIHGAMNFLGIFKTLEAEGLINEQLEILKTSQGGVYKPFISSTVNEALRLKISSTDQILKLIGLFKPTANVQINNIQSQTSIKAIGMDEAMRLLDKKGLTQISYDPNSHTHIKALYGLEKTPEVRANFQQASNTDGILKLPPNPKTSHINRRANEEDLDTEELL